MDLKELQKFGAIVPRTLIKKTIDFEYYPLKSQKEWADPETPEREDTKVPGSTTTYIRKVSSADALEISNSSDRERPFVGIFRCVCDEKGVPVFPTIEDAMALDTWFVVPLFNAINSVNGIAPKNFKPRTNSGATSPSASAEKVSRNGKSASRTRKNSPGDASTKSAAT